MRTYVIEGICTALSSISHNGGERNGTIVQLRREKFVQDNGSVAEIPVISGNSVRGKLRDLAAIDILTRPDGTKIQVDADTFNLLFSGGSLESVGNKHLDIEKVRKLRKDIPVLSVLGCSIGNVILPGKVDIGKMIPICKETLAYIPEKYHGENIKTIWEYCQVEMNTRRDDTKDENKREFIKEGFLTDDLKGGQMMYHTETLVSGTKFYWKICLRDTTDQETGAFLSLIQQWSKQSSQVGGNGRVGHGKLKLDLQETYVVDSEIEFKNSDFVNYINAAEEAKADTTEYFEQGLQEEFFK